MGVARARPRPALANRTTRCRAATTRGTTSTSTRPTRAARATCCSRRATRGRCTTSTSAAARSAGGSAARTAASRLGPGDALLLAARRRVPARRADLAVRQRLDAAEGEAVARACCSNPNASNHTVSARQAVHQPGTTLLASSQGNTLACPAATGCWATAGCRTSPSTTPPVTCCSTARSARTCRTSRPSSPRGAGTRRRAPSARRRSRRRGTLVASPSAGTARPTSPRWRVLAGLLERRARAGRDGAAKAGFETTIKARDAPVRTCRCRRSTHRAACSAPRRRSKPESRPRCSMLLARRPRCWCSGRPGGSAARPLTTRRARRRRERAAAAPAARARTRRPARPRARRRRSTAPRCWPARVTVSPAARQRATPRPTTQISLLGVPAAAALGRHRARLAQRRPRRAAARLLAGRRRELRARRVRSRRGERVARPRRAARRRRARSRSRGASASPCRTRAAKPAAARRPAPKPSVLPALSLAPGPAAADVDRHRPRRRRDARRHLLAPYSGPGQYGPMILDEDGAARLVQAAVAAGHARRRLARAAVRRQTGADVVAGPADRRRPAARPGR